MVIKKLVLSNSWQQIRSWFIIPQTLQTCLIWKNLVSLSKISLMGHFSHSVLAKKYQFCIRIRKKWKIWIFEIHYASYILNSKVKFKNHIFQYCLILLQNWYFLAKTEWEKCPISDILDKLTKLFQIRQVCASLCDNKPYPNFASKVVFYDAYHQYKLCF